ncbi:hypothetical protein PO628_23635, partial [Escherichia coli]
SVRHIFKPISYLEIQLLSGVSGGYIINGDQWIVVRGIETAAKRHAMFLVPEFIEKLERLKRSVLCG